MTLDCTVTRDAGTTLVRLAGSIDREAGPRFDTLRAATEDASAIDLDLGAVDYISSSGIALLVGLLIQARGSGTPVRALGLTPHYQHIFDITRLSDFLEVVRPAETQGGDRGDR
jgi:anti-sigma B factor antagonist